LGGDGLGILTDIFVCAVVQRDEDIQENNHDNLNAQESEVRSLKDTGPEKSFHELPRPKRNRKSGSIGKVLIDDSGITYKGKHIVQNDAERRTKPLEATKVRALHDGVCHGLENEEGIIGGHIVSTIH
jgi:hypothetical protein